MTFDPARPRYTLPLAGVDYELEGSFGLIEAVENALKEGVLSVAARLMDMPAAETARVATAMLSASGYKVTLSEVGSAIYGMGLSGEAFAALKLHLFAALRVFVSPPADREAVASDVGEMIGKWSAASPGKSTSSSASASSAGRPTPSGAAASPT